MFCLSLTDLRRLAFDIAVRADMTHPFDAAKGLAGVDWAKAFLDRHPDISLGRPIATHLARITSFNKEAVVDFYQKCRGGSGFLPEVQIRTDRGRFHRDSHRGTACFKWYNGRHGCSFCTHEGQVAKQGSGFSSMYPLEILIPPFRTVQQTVCGATIGTQTGQAENGVKTASDLLLLRSFDKVNSFPVVFWRSRALHVHVA